MHSPLYQKRKQITFLKAEKGGAYNMVCSGMMAGGRKLVYCSFVIFAAIVVTLYGQLVPETDPTSDECINEAYQYWLKVLLNRFIRYADLTAAMSSSRRLFGAFLAQKMSSATFKEYCKEHRYARSYFNRCDNSTYKKMVVSNFGLADYICATRVGDYGRALSCLHRANDWATLIICGPNCTQFENDSNTYLDGNIGSNSTADIMHVMAGDCRYLKCMTSCRHSLIEEECGKEAASLMLDALRVTFATSLDLYEPPEMRQMMKGGFQSTYPDECRQLASGDIFRNDGSKGARGANMAESKGNSRKIRMVVALSTDVLTNASLMCRFGEKIQQFFAPYCADDRMDVADADFVSLAVAVP